MDSGKMKRSYLLGVIPFSMLAGSFLRQEAVALWEHSKDIGGATFGACVCLFFAIIISYWEELR